MKLTVRSADQPLQCALAAYLAAVLLHCDRLPLWCSLSALLAVGWRVYSAVQPQSAPPHRVLRWALTVLLVVLTMLNFRTLNGIAAGSALLTVMGAAKLLETHARRDGYIVTAVALILLLSACLDRQGLLRLPLYAAVLWLACAALAALGSARPGGHPLQALRSGGRALALALPLALILFWVFPRLATPLWGMPNEQRANTGLSDEMSPGSISDLAISEEVVFRVKFAGAVPAPAQRYWRGPVLHQFDGYTWRRSPGQIAIASPPQPAGAPVSQRITLEASGNPQWFALDRVLESPSPRVRLSFDGQLLATRPVTQTQTYDVVSYLQTRDEAPLSYTARKLDLQLPPQRNPRTLALAAQLRAASHSEADYVQRVLNYLHDGGFEYSLTPPLLNLDSIDDLLFNTRLGFCGHYASAYALLMRAAGLPARVVTGYQGGEWNAIGGYMVLRQSDAHAWTEVWLQGQGWVRIDPTAVVAPSRLQRGLRELLPDSRWTLQSYGRNSPLLRELLQRWDAGNQWWQERVLGYNRLAQQRYWGRWGDALDSVQWQVLTLLLAGAAWSVWVWWALRQRPASGASEGLARDWAALRSSLARAGVRDSASLGPLALAAAAASRFPQHREQLSTAAAAYAQQRYGRAPEAKPTAALRRELRRLSRQLAAAGLSRRIFHPQQQQTTGTEQQHQ